MAESVVGARQEVGGVSSWVTDVRGGVGVWGTVVMVVVVIAHLVISGALRTEHSWMWVRWEISHGATA